jgi:hypothetical protein
MKHRLLLLTPMEGHGLGRLMRVFSPHAEVTVLRDLSALETAFTDANTTMLCVGTGVIVPEAILNRFRGPAYNLHAASPEFPGRDPHHHAIYRNARRYGATLHIMTANVDAGPIVAVEWFDVDDKATPQSLLAMANEAGLALIERIGERLLEPSPLPSVRGVAWGAVKTKRTDLERLAQISPLVGEAEFARRLRALEHNTHNNLLVDLHGHRFRIEGTTQRSVRATEVFAEFTETGFRNLVRSLKSSGYRFSRYGEETSGRHVIWRHDVDLSMHRAARLAEIEAEEGVSSTWFINPHSSLYNLLEPEIDALTRRILASGHEIGLHFDAGAYAIKDWTQATLEPAIARERNILETILGQKIRSMSWHNPDMSNLLTFDAEVLGGLYNAYCGRLRRDYVYCSDSNGYWRFEPMVEVIAQGHPRLHLLTHPDWWTPEPMAPSDRVDRALIGRARKVRSDYDRLLEVGGRRNMT